MNPDKSRLFKKSPILAKIAKKNFGSGEYLFTRGSPYLLVNINSPESLFTGK